MHRSYDSALENCNTGEIVSLSKEESFHIVKVLRLKNGDHIEICDGNGRAFLGEIINPSALVQIKILSELDSNEPETNVVLYQSLSKGTKMDLVIQKAVELGVNEIVPVATEFSVVKINDSDNKTSRWRKIASEAVKQCKRSAVPLISEPVKFKDAIDNMSKHDVSLVAYECEKERKITDDLFVDATSVGIFIGPEGGFSQAEIEYATQKGVIPVTLGKRIMRTETAAIALSAIVMYKLGELD